MTAAAPPIEPGGALSSARLPRPLVRLLPWLGALMVAIAAIMAPRSFVPVMALTHRIDRGPVFVEAFGRATVESQRQADLGFAMVGRVAEVLVDEGDRVKQGQELARLAPEQLQADLKTAVSTIGAARTALQRLAADEQRARIALEAAQREAARAQTLAPDGRISQRELDAANDQLRMARADLSLTAAAVVTMVQYNLVLERTHELAVLKLMGASSRRLLVLVLQGANVPVVTHDHRALDVFDKIYEMEDGRARDRQASKPKTGWRRQEP